MTMGQWCRGVMWEQGCNVGELSTLGVFGDKWFELHRRRANLLTMGMITGDVLLPRQLGPDPVHVDSDT